MFGVQAAPPATGEVGGADPPPASSTPNASSSTPLPPVPAPFSMPSASFTFQGPSGNLMPPPRPPSAPAGFPFPGAPPRFTYPNVPATVPPSASPFSVQPGFTFQGPAVGMANLQPGQSAAVGVRPFPPTGMPASVSPPAQTSLPPASTQGSQTGLPGSMAAADTTPGPSVPTGTGPSAEASSATPPGSLQVPGSQARPPTTSPPITGMPGQIQVSAVPPAVAAARPGLALPTSTTLPYVPPRPTFTPTPVAGAAIVPPGVLSYCFGEAAKLLILVENIKHLL